MTDVFKPNVKLRCNLTMDYLVTCFFLLVLNPSYDMILTNEIVGEIEDLRNSQKKNLEDSLMKLIELKYLLLLVLNYDMYLALS